MNQVTEVGDWQKIADLGSGAFGVVSLWKNKITEEAIAIKKCKFQLNANLTTKQRERWNNEVEIMKIINHPNVIKYKVIPLELEMVLMKNNPTKLPLLPMEYCRNGNLRRILCKPPNLSGLEEQDVRYILEDISKGLQHLHKLNITHRDIKPENIVLQHCDYRKGNTIYKIIDLGYAKELNDTVVSFVGTLHYLAPEIFQGDKYNKSVDYWSLGLVTFEIICGVLPFLPHLLPVERFIKIKEKDPEDICIYLNYSGQVTNSSEIKKENLISNCLKQNIEVWLKHVLQYDQQLRSQNFPNNVQVFDCLQSILKKNIINVFSMTKLESYSYEINESTLTGTLKDWICRDIKAEHKQIILLVEKGIHLTDNTQLLLETFNSYNEVYVVKKSALVNTPVSYFIPKLVREVLKSAKKFNPKYIRQLYAQTIYYIKAEKRIADHFRFGFHLYINYLNDLVKTVNDNKLKTSKKLTKLLTEIECYFNIRRNNVCDIDIVQNKTYRDSLIFSQRLLGSVNRSLSNFRDLERHVKIINNHHAALNQYLPYIRKIVSSYNLDDNFLEAIKLLDKNKPEVKNMNFISAVASIASRTIKAKDALFRNKQFMAYISAAAKILNDTDRLISWIGEFDNHICDLSNCFKQNESTYWHIILTASYKDKDNRVNSKSCLHEELNRFSSSYLIQENYNLRVMFEDILAKSILEHKQYVDTVTHLKL